MRHTRQLCQLGVESPHSPQAFQILARRIYCCRARYSVDESHASLVLEDSLVALTILSEDKSATRLMATVEFLLVVTWYLCKGSINANENACLSSRNFLWRKD
uniref:Uncharacterized protein n=1 Tax=Physcomitrium patens TaxID=3218 RepID=A0A2K1JSW9_PHYPA|nr:hypothetical protein PHYPA_014403 [Physcomitrium patens]